MHVDENGCAGVDREEAVCSPGEKSHQGPILLAGYLQFGLPASGNKFLLFEPLNLWAITEP